MDCPLIALVLQSSTNFCEWDVWFESTGHSETKQFYVPRFGDDDVFELQVSMNDTVILTVVESIRELLTEVACSLFLQSTMLYYIVEQ